MKFISTRGKGVAENSAEAIVKGLSEDGGLFVPERFPCIKDKIADMLEMDYAERACFVLSQFLEEYDKADLLSACKRAYSLFDDDDPAPLVKIDDNLFIMELFHGPTLAFKDIALTLLPYLLRKGADILDKKDKILILVATSGDTGKSALEGFKDNKGVAINVFYPQEGVSDMQKLQMRTQEGANVNVVGVEGNFDDCQTAVKRIFSDDKLNADLKDKGIVLSSANSINFGRLAPQIVYYFSAYCDLVNSDEIKLGDEVNFTVPTGNFGDILAGYYAKKMGLPVGKLVCASNSNNVLTEFFESGDYDINREFFKTTSPSMDIIISSNLERLIFEVSGRNAKLTEERMSELKKTGKYTVSAKEKAMLSTEFFADYCDEAECEATISDFFDEYGYVADTHTAVAIDVSDSYLSYTGDNRKMVVLSTANPYKFPQSVYKALNGKSIKDAFTASEKLYSLTACPIPTQISELKNKEIRFSAVCKKNETEKAVLDFAEKLKDI